MFYPMEHLCPAKRGPKQRKTEVKEPVPEIAAFAGGFILAFFAALAFRRLMTFLPFWPAQGRPATPPK